MLKYIGDGRWLPDIPARDLDDAEITELAERLRWPQLRDTLLDCGLYEEYLPQTTAQPPKKADTRKRENKILRNTPIDL